MVEETKKLTEKQEAFLEALCGEAKGNIRGAMNIAGYSENTKVSEIVSSLKDEIVERNKFDPVVKKKKNVPYLVDQHLLEKENV